MKTVLSIALLFVSICFFIEKANAQTTKGKPIDSVAASKKITPEKVGAKVPMTKIEIPRMVVVEVAKDVTPKYRYSLMQGIIDPPEQPAIIFPTRETIYYNGCAGFHTPIPRQKNSLFDSPNETQIILPSRDPKP